MFLEAIVLLLIGLVLPISLLVIAALFDVGVLLWALYVTWTDRVLPQLAQVLGHGLRPARRAGHVVS